MTPTVPHSDFMDFITGAGPVAKFVLLVLVAFSLASWAVILGKWRQFRRVQQASAQFVTVFREGRSSATLAATKRFAASPQAQMYAAAYKEFAGVSEVVNGIPDDDRTQRTENVTRALQQTSALEIDELERMLPFLATTASATPFIGLFGTVWGIMGAFHGIGHQGSASLAVVAPGISEALIATAAGLAVAIPAVMAYNYFGAQLRRTGTQLDAFTLEVLNALNRPPGKRAVTEAV